MAAVDLPVPRLGGGGQTGADPALGDVPVLRAPAGWAPTGAGPELAGVGFAGRELLLRVFDAGLACCAVEVSAALRRFAEPLPQDGGVPQLHVLVVAGTVTDKLAPLVLRAYRDLPEPRLVLSFGACSNSGGPYWDSYCVTKGVDQIIPVDVYVPGCPPRPEALVHGLRLLLSARGLDADALDARGAAP
jgi:NADH-quinone oxidoreductase subunit B